MRVLRFTEDMIVLLQFTHDKLFLKYFA